MLPRIQIYVELFFVMVVTLPSSRVFVFDFAAVKFVERNSFGCDILLNKIFCFRVRANTAVGRCRSVAERRVLFADFRFSLNTVVPKCVDYVVDVAATVAASWMVFAEIPNVVDHKFVLVNSFRQFLNINSNFTNVSSKLLFAFVITKIWFQLLNEPVK